MSDRTDRLREAHAVAAVRSSARRRMDRVTGAWLEILQTGVAAAVAWQAAKLIVGQSQPFFAPVAAVLALGLSRGQPRRRAVELGLGVAVGILIADLLVQLIGTGTWQIGVVVVLAMSAALVVGAGILLVNQAAISAILVITLPSLSQGGTLDRLFDALIGAAVALVLSQVLFPRDPVRQMGRAAGKVLDELALALDETAVALADADQGAGRARARAGARAGRRDRRASTTPWPWGARTRGSRPRAGGARWATCARTPTPPGRWTTRCATPASWPATRPRPPAPGRPTRSWRTRWPSWPTRCARWAASWPPPARRTRRRATWPARRPTRPPSVLEPAQRPAHEHGGGPDPGHGHRPAARHRPGHPGRAAHAAGRLAMRR